MTMRTTLAAVGLAAGMSLLAACGSGSSDSKADAPTTPPTTTAAAPTTTTPSPVKASPKPKPKPKPRSLAHGPQHGLSNCIISYEDAQKGAGTSTFSALVLSNSGTPYSPISSKYDLMLTLALVGDDGTQYPVSEALGHGSRTAADNGGSDWFTTDQGQVEVSANSTEGMVLSTLQIPLAQVKSVEGNVLVTSETDDNYLKQLTCAVRPA